MTSQVFYRKWRSQTFAEIVGQEPITKTLYNALISDRISHAYLFCGPRGTGKTSTARILAKAVNCLDRTDGEPCNSCDICQAITEVRSLDVIEIDAASNTGVDDIRSLREKVNYAPNQSRYKVYIIDEVHMLSNSASNALLKTLEEPPSHVIFILATTEVHKILPTILSRCQRFDFRRLSQADIISKLNRICEKEEIHIKPEALQLIAKSATGSLRDAENLLEQLFTYYGPEIDLQQVQTLLGITGDFRVKELVKHIINNDIAAGMTTINSVNNDGLDLKQFNRELVEYLRGLLLIKTGSNDAVDMVAEDIAELKALAANASLEQILSAVRLFGQLEIGFDNYPTLPLELALVDSTLAPEVEKESRVEKTEKEIPGPQKETTPPPTPSRYEQPVKEATPPSVPSRHEQPVKEATPPSIPSRHEQPVKETAPPSVPSYSEQAEEEPAPVSIEEPEPEPVMAAATTPPLEAGGEVERLRLNWKQLIEQAPPDTKRTAAMAILRSAGIKPVAFENDTVVLAFRYRNHKELIEKVENQQVAEKIIGNFLGHPCRINCVLEDNHLIKAALRMGAQIIDREEK
jgi:DNA polymerase-3 subunit gamma/tau